MAAAERRVAALAAAALLQAIAYHPPVNLVIMMLRFRDRLSLSSSARRCITCALKRRARSCGSAICAMAAGRTSVGSWAHTCSSFVSLRGSHVKAQRMRLDEYSQSGS